MKLPQTGRTRCIPKTTLTSRTCLKLHHPKPTRTHTIRQDKARHTSLTRHHTQAAEASPSFSVDRSLRLGLGNRQASPSIPRLASPRYIKNYGNSSWQWTDSTKQARRGHDLKSHASRNRTPVSRLSLPADTRCCLFSPLTSTSTPNAQPLSHARRLLGILEKTNYILSLSLDSQTHSRREHRHLDRDLSASLLGSFLSQPFSFHKISLSGYNSH